MCPATPKFLWLQRCLSDASSADMEITGASARRVRVAILFGRWRLLKPQECNMARQRLIISHVFKMLQCDSGYGFRSQMARIAPKTGTNTHSLERRRRKIRGECAGGSAPSVGALQCDHPATP